MMLLGLLLLMMLLKLLLLLVMLRLLLLVMVVLLLRCRWLWEAVLGRGGNRGGYGRLRARAAARLAAIPSVSQS